MWCFIMAIILFHFFLFYKQIQKRIADGGKIDRPWKDLINVLQYEILPSLLMFVIFFLIFSFNAGTIIMFILSIIGYVLLQIGFLKEIRLMKTIGRCIIGVSILVLMIINTATVYWGLQY